MDVVIEYTEEVKTSLTKDFFQAVAARTLEECHFTFLQDKAIRINVVALSEAKIQQLNHTYRGKDKVTDILSFGEYVTRVSLAAETAQEIFLGELFFCPSFVEQAAQEDGVSFEHEMVYIFSHGVLHLVGFDHEEAMFTIQDTITFLFSKKAV
ncbi:MAG TPA: rRNA maturation RNase YbeY [Patescibacteria group bacterium]|nr:rRNA maturation RNase YbeY [Patescibacteria group bacterium]